MATETGTTRLWVRLALFASLALNLVVVGIVAGFVARGGPDRDGGPHGREAAIPYTRALNEDDRHALRDELRRVFRDRQAAAGDVASDYREAVTVLQGDPFERGALEAVMARQDARAEMRQQAGRRALVDVVVAMSPDQRRAYATRLSEQIDRAERRWRRRD